MKKFVMFVMLIVFSFAMPIMACDDPPDLDCGDVWVGGANDQIQWQNFTKQGLTNGGIFNAVGGQHVNTWGAITGYGYGEYSSNTMQVEGMDLVNAIPGGEVFNRHQAIQNSEIDISGDNANAWILGDNAFGTKTVVYTNEVQPCGNEITMRSQDTNFLNMDASLCVNGGTAKYNSEVVTETGHFQRLDLPNGTGFSSSYSGQRGYVELEQ